MSDDMDVDEPEVGPGHKSGSKKLPELPNEVWDIIISHLNTTSLLALSQTYKGPFDAIHHVLCETARLDISPTRAAYEGLLSVQRLLDGASFYDRVMALTFTTTDCSYSDRATHAIQLSILKVVVDLSKLCTRLRHFGLYSHYLSKEQLRAISSLAQSRIWAVHSIELRGHANSIFAAHFDWSACRYFSTDQDFNHPVILKVSTGTNKKLKRLALTASYESRPGSMSEGMSTAPPAINPALLEYVNEAFPALEWLVIRSAPWQRDFYYRPLSKSMETSFMQIIGSFKNLERLSIQILNVHVHREATRKNNKSKKPTEISPGMWKWCSTFATSILERKPSLKTVCVRLDWPYYITVCRGEDRELTETTGKFDKVDRYGFPIGLCYY